MARLSWLLPHGDANWRALLPGAALFAIGQARRSRSPRGGLGFVEAGLTATLALATLAYRLFSFWLPIPVGLAAALAHRHRYGGRGTDVAAADAR